MKSKSLNEIQLSVSEFRDRHLPEVSNEYRPNDCLCSTIGNSADDFLLDNRE